MRYAIALLIGFGASSMTGTISAAQGDAPTSAPTTNKSPDKNSPENKSPEHCDPPARLGPRADATLGTPAGVPTGNVAGVSGGQTDPTSPLAVPSLGVPTLTDPAITGQPYDVANNPANANTNTNANANTRANAGADRKTASAFDDAPQEARPAISGLNRQPIIAPQVIQPSLTKPALVQPSLTLPSVTQGAIFVPPAGVPNDPGNGTANGTANGAGNDAAAGAVDGAVAGVNAGGPSADAIRTMQQSLGRTPAQSYSADTPDLAATALPTPLPTAPPPGSVVQLRKPSLIEARSGILPLETLGTDPHFLPYYYGPFDQGTAWGFDFSDPFTYRPGGGVYRRNDVRVNRDLDTRINNDIDHRVNVDVDRRTNIHYDPRKNPK